MSSSTWRKPTPCVTFLCKKDRETVGVVGIVDWWKELVSCHPEEQAACETTVEQSTHVSHGLGPRFADGPSFTRSPGRYSSVYPQSGLVIHRRMAVIHIFMLMRVCHRLVPSYCLPFLPSSSSKSSELMNSRKGESPSSSATSGSLSSAGCSSSAAFSSSSAVVPARSKTCGST